DSKSSIGNIPDKHGRSLPHQSLIRLGLRTSLSLGIADWKGWREKRKREALRRQRPRFRAILHMGKARSAIRTLEANESDLLRVSSDSCNQDVEDKASRDKRTPSASTLGRSS